ncbi:MAG: carbohydrate kinase family protein [Solirubrobacteraceae bacterium]|jgi:sugar/nucleoside kinase (ribokinase family)|nr:carbohydrate kinase family protein [Solirubrobacteraceae bacterium]
MSGAPFRILGAGPSGGPDLVCAGNLLLDDIVYPDGRTRMGEPGGASIYVSLAAALWGARVAVASVRGLDYPQGMLEALAARGIDLSGVRELEGEGLRTWLLYERAGRRVVHQLGRPGHAEVSPRPADLPAALRGARAYHLAPMPLELQRGWVEVLAAERSSAISLDPHEPVREDNLAGWRAVLANVDAFFPSRDELQLEGVEDAPEAALRRLAGGRLRFVAFKRGAEGGLLYDARADACLEWPPVPRLTGDPTGAGDAFAGGFLAALLAGRGVEEALDQGIVATSFALEDFGAHGLLAATRDEAERRRREWFDLEART